MDCQEAREQILDSLAEAQAGESSKHLAAHLAGCPGCQRFFEVHQQLDAGLSLAIPAPPLPPGFSESVRRGIGRERSSAWSELLPDGAHWVGCLSAILLSLWLLPFTAVSTLSAGLLLAVATYIVQSFLFEAMED